MTVTSGFFNSKNHDRLYNAEQLSSIFDGVITDGIFQSIGDAFFVHSLTTSDNTVLVGTGRAWFDHTWTLNDTPYSIVLDPPNTALGRIDAVVIDVDSTESVRKNSIMLIKGTYAETPERPTLIKEPRHNQYPLCYINVPAGSSAPISDANIVNVIGTDACPLITGILDTLDIDMFVNQMESKFDIWFENLQANLDGNIASNLQNQIDKLKEAMEDANAGAINASTLEKVRNISFKSVSPVDAVSNILWSFIIPNYGIFSIGGNSAANETWGYSYNTDGVLQNSAKICDGFNSSINIIDSFYVENNLKVYVSGGSINKTSSEITGCSMILYEIMVSGLNGTISTNTSTSSITFAEANRGIAGSGYTPNIEYTDFPLKQENGYITNAISAYSSFYGSYGYTFKGSTGLFVINPEYVISKTTEIPYAFLGTIGMYQSTNPSKNNYICLSEMSHVYGATGYPVRTTLVDPSTYAFVSFTPNELYETETKYLRCRGSGLIVATSETIGEYKNSFSPSSYIDIPMAIEVSWSLDSAESFGEWKAGIMAPDKNLLLVGSANKVRVGVIPDVGLMIWGSPVNSSALSSSANSRAQVVLSEEASWWVNESKTKYMFINGWNVSVGTPNAESYFYVDVKNVNKPTLLVIELGD